MDSGHRFISRQLQVVRISGFFYKVQEQDNL